MRTTFLFAQPAFGPRLGVAMYPVRLGVPISGPPAPGEKCVQTGQSASDVEGVQKCHRILDCTTTTGEKVNRIEEIPCDQPTSDDCPEGQTRNYKNECVPGNFHACRNSDGSWRLFKFDGDVDPKNDVYYGNAPNAFANGVNYPEGVVASIADANGIYCQEHPVPSEAPVQPTPPPPPAAQAPPPQGEGTVPLSIDIQAFTPQGTGPVPMRPTPQPPKQQEPAPAKAQWIAPKPVEEKTLDTGSAVGIGAFLVAIGAATFFGGK